MESDSKPNPRPEIQDLGKSLIRNVGSFAVKANATWTVLAAAEEIPTIITVTFQHLTQSLLCLGLSWPCAVLARPSSADRPCRGNEGRTAPGGAGSGRCSYLKCRHGPSRRKATARRALPVCGFFCLTIYVILLLTVHSLLKK